MISVFWLCSLVFHQFFRGCNGNFYRTSVGLAFDDCSISCPVLRLRFLDKFALILVCTPVAVLHLLSSFTFGSPHSSTKGLVCSEKLFACCRCEF